MPRRAASNTSPEAISHVAPSYIRELLTDCRNSFGATCPIVQHACQLPSPLTVTVDFSASAGVQPTARVHSRDNPIIESDEIDSDCGIVEATYSGPPC